MCDILLTYCTSYHADAVKDQYSGYRLIGIRIKGIFGYLGFIFESHLLNNSEKNYIRTKGIFG